MTCKDCIHFNACCGEEYEVDYYCDDYKYCPWCGQMIDWRDFK